MRYVWIRAGCWGLTSAAPHVTKSVLHNYRSGFVDAASASGGDGMFPASFFRSKASLPTSAVSDLCNDLVLHNIVAKAGIECNARV
jgi:hypothetical protein